MLAIVLLAALIGLGGPAAAGAIAADTDRVDLELVLAVDASGSVSDEEYALQLAGIAAALRDDEVQRAIGAGPRGRIAVALMIWADATMPKDASAWHVLTGGAEAEAVARIAERYPRRVEGGTGIGSAVAMGIRLIRENGIESDRQVVDVSGDGIETPLREDTSIALPAARNMAKASGVTVNGLAIVNEVHDLDAYYRQEMIAGADCFVMRAVDYRDFARAIREKLLREIGLKVAGPGLSPADRRREVRMALRPTH